MKFLVERFSGQISGGYEDLDGFPLSGSMVIDVPYTDFVYDNPAPTLTGLINKKYDRVSEEVNTLFAYSNYVKEEFTGVPGSVNTAFSSLYSLGPDRRTYLRPNGVLVLGSIPLGFTFSGIETSLLCRYNAYSISSVPNKDVWGPPIWELNTAFSPLTDMQFVLLDSLGNPLQTLTSGLNTASLGGYSGLFYISLLNTSARTLVLSDFCLYWL